MKEADFKDFYLCEAAGLFLIYNVGNPKIGYREPLQVNESGAYIFKQLSIGKSPEEIASILTDEYGVERSEALSDVNGFIANILSMGV